MVLFHCSTRYASAHIQYRIYFHGCGASERVARDEWKTGKCRLDSDTERNITSHTLLISKEVAQKQLFSSYED
ncbi:unnamed protein product [Spodoptera littoralis]|uniref:Uncharacterized protein n=1 Tax=Spodoptera littoralis TaxID=7109 RepID=A0A9P0ICD7_SPOLI|nr:unnamed protein product [Spodoptera littoralis]